MYIFFEYFIFRALMFYNLEKINDNMALFNVYSLLKYA